MEYGNAANLCVYKMFNWKFLTTKKVPCKFLLQLTALLYKKCVSELSLVEYIYLWVRVPICRKHFIVFFWKYLISIPTHYLGFSRLKCFTLFQYFYRVLFFFLLSLALSKNIAILIFLFRKIILKIYDRIKCFLYQENFHL